MVVSSTNKPWIDTSVLPTSILSLKDDDFYLIVKHLTGEPVVELIRIQAINHVRVFLRVPDILDVINIKSSQLNHVRNQTCFFLMDGSYRVKLGIKIPLEYLRDLFTAKLNEYHDGKQRRNVLNDSNTSTTSDGNVSIGQKRRLILDSSEQTLVKRGRK
ncbi:hypothetical protein I4U23_002978 [Adineta vaga]|nr:hypothetical protein I4U23_002978 [Adineta vaga]